MPPHDDSPFDPATLAGPVLDDPLALAADEIGDRWSLLIIWAAVQGTSRFDDFHRDLNVARNILSNRLRRLVELGILHKRPVRDGARRMEYALTCKGHALHAPMHHLRDWAVVWSGALPAEELEVVSAAVEADRRAGRAAR